MLESKIKELTNKGWCLKISSNPAGWDVAMAVSPWDMRTDNYYVCHGSSKSLLETIEVVEKWFYRTCHVKLLEITS